MPLNFRQRAYSARTLDSFRDSALASSMDSPMDAGAPFLFDTLSKIAQALPQGVSGFGRRTPFCSGVNRRLKGALTQF